MNWKIAFWIAAVAAPGPVAVSWLALPALVKQRELAVSMEVLQIVTAAQSLVLLCIAAGLGALLSAKVGLRAPALSALSAQGGFFAALQAQLLPGLAGGLLGALVILGFYAFAPEQLLSVLNQNAIPVVARVLYGGITEEVLIRWGLMTLLVWAGWRLFQGGTGVPSAAIFWSAIGVSALVFGVSHVPALVASMADVPAALIAYITIGNAVFGLIAGYLYWRHGLEAAMVAHVSAHVLAYLVRG